MRIGVLFNPHSRDNRRHPERAAALQEVLGVRGQVVVTQQPEALPEQLEALRQDGVELLAICGGDGTQHAVLSALPAAWGEAPWPAIVPLRGGTMNTVANSLGVPRDKPERLLASYLRRAVAAPPHTAQRRTARVAGQLGFLFGVGAVHGFLAEYYRDQDPNAITAARTLARAARGALARGALDPATARITAPFDGHVEFTHGPPWERHRYLAITGGTIEDMGLGFRPFARARARDDAFQLLGLHGTPSALTRALPRIWRGQPMGDRASYDTLTDQAQLVPADDAPYGYMIDGDLYSHRGPLSIELGPVVHFSF